MRIPYNVEMTAKEAAEWIRTHTPVTVGRWLHAIDKACAALDYMEFMKSQHNCNDCGYKECEHRPKWGDPVRVNCFMWRAKDGSDREEKQNEE